MLSSKCLYLKVPPEMSMYILCLRKDVKFSPSPLRRAPALWGGLKNLALKKSSATQGWPQ